jgi:hypothetical protein
MWQSFRNTLISIKQGFIYYGILFHLAELFASYLYKLSEPFDSQALANLRVLASEMKCEYVRVASQNEYSRVLVTRKWTYPYSRQGKWTYPYSFYSIITPLFWLVLILKNPVLWSLNFLLNLSFVLPLITESL